MIRAVARRIDKLEDLLGIAAPKGPCRVWVLRLFGRELALDDDRCVEILREYGFLANIRSFAIVHVCDIPNGLNAEELEKFLRENGEGICGPIRPAGGVKRAAQR